MKCWTAPILTRAAWDAAPSGVGGHCLAITCAVRCRFLLQYLAFPSPPPSCCQTGRWHAHSHCSLTHALLMVMATIVVLVQRCHPSTFYHAAGSSSVRREPHYVFAIGPPLCGIVCLVDHLCVLGGADTMVSVWRTDRDRPLCLLQQLFMRPVSDLAWSVASGSSFDIRTYVVIWSFFGGPWGFCIATPCGRGVTRDASLARYGTRAMVRERRCGEGERRWVAVDTWRFLIMYLVLLDPHRRGRTLLCSSFAGRIAAVRFTDNDGPGGLGWIKERAELTPAHASHRTTPAFFGGNLFGAASGLASPWADARTPGGPHAQLLDALGLGSPPSTAPCSDEVSGGGSLAAAASLLERLGLGTAAQRLVASALDERGGGGGGSSSAPFLAFFPFVPLPPTYAPTQSSPGEHKQQLPLYKELGPLCTLLGQCPPLSALILYREVSAA